MLHFLAIVVMIIGLAGAFFTFVGTMPYGTPTIWGIVAVVGIIATFATRRPAN